MDKMYNKECIVYIFINQCITLGKCWYYNAFVGNIIMDDNNNDDNMSI